MKFLKIFSELSIARLSILAVLVTAGYYLVYFDNGETIDKQIVDVNGQLSSEKAKRTEIEKKMKKEEEMRGNLLQLARNLDLVKSKIPNEFTEIEITSILNKLAQLSQVKILSLKRSTTNGTGNSTLSAKGKAIPGAELIEEVSFSIDITGSFNAIIQFVEYLSKEEKTIKVRNFTLEKGTPAGVEPNVINFRGEIVAYKQALVVKPVEASP